MKILILGSTGILGKTLFFYLKSKKLVFLVYLEKKKTLFILKISKIFQN